MKEFLIALSLGVREIPKKYQHLYEQIKSCGAITKDSKVFRLSDKFFIAQVSKHTNGMFLRDITRPKDKDIRLKHRQSRLKDGDIALVLRISQAPKIIKILSHTNEHTPQLVFLEKKKGKIVGIKLKSLESFHLPFSQKSLQELPRHCVLSLKGDKITKILGSLDDPHIDEAISLFLGGREADFSQATKDIALAFGTKLDSSLYPMREDLSHLDFITIDPNDAKDHDDAIYFDTTHHTLYVAIADVSEYVMTNTSLDEEAKNRCFSLYFPHICYPMLPKELSENLCSLRKNELKLAMVWEIRLHKRTKLPIRSRLFEAIIQPKQNLSYQEVDEFLATKQGKVAQFSWLVDMVAITHKLKNHRLKTGYDFYSEEIKLHLDKNTNLESITIATPTLSHSLIEESMLLANVCSAQMLSEKLNGLGIYRVHNEPSKDRIYALFSELEDLGYQIPKAKLHEQIQSLQSQATSHTQLQMLDKLIIKSQKEAHYQSEVSPHFGLGFEAYTHFTSPIRRYSDIIAHRLLKLLLCAPSVKIHKQIAYILESSSALIPMLNDKERQIAKTEMDFKDRKYARFASRRLGYKCKVRIVDERYPAIGIILDPILLGARVFIMDSKIELVRYDEYNAEILEVAIPAAKIYARILNV